MNINEYNYSNSLNKSGQQLVQDPRRHHSGEQQHQHQRPHPHHCGPRECCHWWVQCKMIRTDRKDKELFVVLILSGELIRCVCGLRQVNDNRNMSHLFIFFPRELTRVLQIIYFRQETANNKRFSHDYSEYKWLIILKILIFSRNFRLVCQAAGAGQAESVQEGEGGGGPRPGQLPHQRRQRRGGLPVFIKVGD